MKPVEFDLGRNHIKVWRNFIRVEFEDGAFIDAAPNYNPSDYAMAAVLGYGTAPDAVERMAFHHDICHVKVCVEAGQPYSKALWLLAHDAVGKRGSITDEDARAFALQCLLNVHTNPDYPPSLLAGCGDLDQLVGSTAAMFEIIEEQLAAQDKAA